MTLLHFYASLTTFRAATVPALRLSSSRPTTRTCLLNPTSHSESVQTLSLLFYPPHLVSIPSISELPVLSTAVLFLLSLSSPTSNNSPSQTSVLSMTPHCQFSAMHHTTSFCSLSLFQERTPRCRHCRILQEPAGSLSGPHHPF
jgi:hypothetical protein